MKKLLLIILNLTFIFQSTAFSQKATAEFLNALNPAKADVKYKDGARQLFIKNNTLFATNFWSGLQVIDISDPDSLRQRAFLPLTDEVHQVKADENYGYIANNRNGLVIFRINDSLSVSIVKTIKLPGRAIAVQPNFPIVYVAMAEAGLARIDISDMNQPEIQTFAFENSWIQNLTTNDRNVFIAAKRNGVSVLSKNNLKEPIATIRNLENAMAIQIDDTLAYIADGAGGLKIVSIQNPAKPKHISHLATQSFVGNVFKYKNYVYLAARQGGVSIINVSDPKIPIVEGSYKTDNLVYGSAKQDVYLYVAEDKKVSALRHNNSPILAAMQNPTIPENERFTLQLSVTEPDGDAFKYAAMNLPEGAIFDDTKGEFSWTPRFDQSGNYENIIFQVTEQTASNISVFDTISIQVNHVNRLPDLPDLNDVNLLENETISLQLEVGSDPDPEDEGNFTYSAEKLPDGATFDAMTRKFSWQPNFDQSGEYVVDFLMKDGAGGIDREAVQITVTHVDRAPVINPVSAQMIDENSELSIKISGTELDTEDLNKIAYRIENLPEGATFDTETQIFSWTPSFDQSNSYENIIAILEAGAFSDSSVFSITVNHVNREPMLSEIAEQNVNEDAELTFQVSGTDPDVEDTDKWTYSAMNLPEGATFDTETATFTWQPNFEQSGEYSNVTFIINDPQGLSDEQKALITVAHVNRKPTIEQIESVSANEMSQINIQINAADPDKEDVGKLTYFAADLPENATLDASTGAFSWQPNFEQSGSYTVTFGVKDAEFSENVTAEIVVIHVNRAPKLNVQESISGAENSKISFNISGSDDDVEDSGKLTFSSANLPEGATFDIETQSFVWEPNFEQSGNYTANFTVTDPAGLSDSKSVNIIVENVNRAPKLSEITAVTSTENMPISIEFIAEDLDKEDAGKLVFSSDNLPSGAQIQQNRLVWTPTFEQSGNYTITVRVNDLENLSDTKTVQLIITNVNRVPKFTSESKFSATAGDTLQFVITASDEDSEDKNKLTFSATDLPPGATLESNGNFVWQSTAENVGEFQMTFTVTDNSGESVSQVVTITLVAPEVEQPVNE